ncbi:TyeA family type III secretion system gatekeeper subunit [Thalassoglobus sp. JC818]|uniref:TyeA family type III secretion system gatekeeper subunit n=1 Tax=Thalassoglobus sp. JC818 TaxID=3232136 RepID=UPI003458951F
MQASENKETAEAIIKEVLPLRNQRRIDSGKLMSLAERLGLHDCEPKIYFLREMAGIVRQLPLKVFESTEERLRLIDGIQEALDLAIEEEEEELEA